jgi:uncharacterized protein (DUF1330 family)
MPAYVVITREKTRNADRLEQYRKLAPASFEQHPVTFRAIHGRHEVLEGPAIEDIIILEFPAMKRLRPGIAAPHTKLPANTASRAAITAAFLPRVSRSNNPIGLTNRQR